MLVESSRESYFIIDTETMGINDNSVVMDISTVFVDMNGLFNIHIEAENTNPLSFNSFLKSGHVHTISLFPNIKEQLEGGLEKSKDTLKFWKELKQESNDKLLDYINKLFSNDGKISVEESMTLFEGFLVKCVAKIPSNVQDYKFIPFLERSGGFDTNKVYNLMDKFWNGSKNSRMKYWMRREIRTVISCNRYRIPESFLRKGTTSWSDGLRNVISKEMGEEFVPHVAINDCLIDAYILYILKMTIEDFYL